MENELLNWLVIFSAIRTSNAKATYLLASSSRQMEMFCISFNFLKILELPSHLIGNEGDEFIMPCHHSNDKGSIFPFIMPCQPH